MSGVCDNCGDATDRILDSGVCYYCDTEGGI